MSEPLITREQAFIEARWALDLARERRDRARAAGLLDPAKELVLRRIERDIRAEQAPAAHRAAA
ncbi:hypothetical protein ACFQ7B_00230 [Streptomyces erythrochromogenes]|uniref:hypothetical protein n=1 Tax=Streptomyces erythrochromogenes TaxID=285574 RepID=UPI003697DC43